MRGGATITGRRGDRVFRDRITALRDVSLTVGLHRGKLNKGVDVATYGAWNNYGTKNAMGWELIPKRQFMMFAADRIFDWMHSAHYREILRDVMLGNISAETAIARIGSQAVAITRKTILDSALYKPNSPETIKRKKSSKPLVHSGVMVQYVNFKAVKL